MDDWRSLEEDADTILLLYRDGYYDPYSEDSGLAEIKVAKNYSDGSLDTIKTRYLEKFNRFENIISFI